MARVPVTPTQPLQTAQYQPVYGSADVPSGAFGSTDARAAVEAGDRLSQVGDSLARRAIEAQHQDNERAVKQADVTLADKIRTLTYGDGTAQNPGYYSQRGDNAIANYQPTVAALRAAHAEVMATLPNDRTRDIFGAVGMSRVVSEESRASSFLDGQRREANNAASLARMDAGVNDASLRWNEPGQLQQSLNINAAEVDAYAKANGLGADAAAALLRKQNGTLLSNVIKAAGRVDPAAAQKIFEDAKNNGTLPGEQLAAIEREMRTDQEFARRQQEHNAVMADRAAQKQATAAYDGYVSKMIDPSNPNGIDLHAVATDPALAAHPQLKVALFNFQNRADKPDPAARISAETTSALYPLIHRPDGDPEKITDPRQLDEHFVAGTLTRSDLGFLRKEIEDEQDPKVKTFGSALNNTIQATAKTIQGANAMGIADPNKAINSNLYVQDTVALLRKARDAGEDLRPYNDPSSPKYIGSAKNVAAYQQPFQKILQDMTSSINAAGKGSALQPRTVPQREPGETIEQWQKRTGQK